MAKKVIAGSKANEKKFNKSICRTLWGFRYIELSATWFNGKNDTQVVLKPYFQAQI